MTDPRQAGDGLVENILREGGLDENVSQDWCQRCHELQEELGKVKAEHALNYTTLKEKIISTDLLIKKYTSKCQECDAHSKKADELQAQLDKYKRDCEVLESRLKASLEETEPLRQTKSRLEASHRQHQRELQELRDRLESSEASKRIYRNAQEVNDNKISELEGQILEMKKAKKEQEASTRKQDALIKKLQDEVAAKKASLSEQKKLLHSVSTARDRHNVRITQLEKILSEHGHSPRGTRPSPRARRRPRGAATTPSQIARRRAEERLPSVGEDASSDEELLLNKLLQDEDLDGDSFNLFRPIALALSPLPPSPPSLQDEPSEDSTDDMAQVLENALSSPTRPPSEQARPERPTTPPPTRQRRRERSKVNSQAIEKEAGSDNKTDAKSTRLVQSGLSRRGVLTLQESLSDPENETEDVPFQKFSQEQLMLRSDLQLSASSTSESESELTGDTSPRRSPRRRNSTGSAEQEQAPERRRTRSMSQGSSSGSESSDGGAPPPETKISKPISQRTQQNASPFKEPLPVAPRRGRRRTVSCRGYLQSSTRLPEKSSSASTRRVTRSISCPDGQENLLKPEDDDVFSMKEDNKTEGEGEIPVIIPMPTRKRTRSASEKGMSDDDSQVSPPKSLCMDMKTDISPQQKDSRPIVQTGNNKQNIKRNNVKGSVSDVKPSIEKMVKIDSAQAGPSSKGQDTKATTSNGETKAKVKTSEEKDLRRSTLVAMKGITRIESGDELHRTSVNPSANKTKGSEGLELSESSMENTDSESSEQIQSKVDSLSKTHKLKSKSDVCEDEEILNPEHQTLSKTTSQGFITQTFEEDIPEEESFLETTRNDMESTSEGKATFYLPESEPSGSSQELKKPVRPLEVPSIIISMVGEVVNSESDLTEDSTNREQGVEGESSESSLQDSSVLPYSGEKDVTKDEQNKPLQTGEPVKSESPVEEVVSNKESNVPVQESSISEVSGSNDTSIVSFVEKVVKTEPVSTEPQNTALVQTPGNAESSAEEAYVSQNSNKGQNKESSSSEKDRYHQQKETKVGSNTSGIVSSPVDQDVSVANVVKTEENGPSQSKGRGMLQRQFSVDTVQEGKKDLSVKGVSLRTKFLVTKNASIEQSEQEDKVSAKSSSDSAEGAPPAATTSAGGATQGKPQQSTSSAGLDNATQGGKVQGPGSTVKQDSLSSESSQSSSKDQDSVAAGPSDDGSENVQIPDDADNDAESGGSNDYDGTAAGTSSNTPAVRPTSLQYGPPSGGRSGTPPTPEVVPHQLQSPVDTPDGDASIRSETPNTLRTSSIMSESPMSSLPPSPMDKVGCVTPISPMLPSDQSEVLSPLSFSLSDTEDPISPLPPSPVPNAKGGDDSESNHEESPSDPSPRSPSESPGPSDKASPFICPIKESGDDGLSGQCVPSPDNSPPVYQPKARVAHQSTQQPKSQETVKAAIAKSAKGKATPGMPSKSSKAKSRPSVNNNQEPKSQKEDEIKKAEDSREGGPLRKAVKKSTTSSQPTQSQEPAKAKHGRPPKRKTSDESTASPIASKVQCASRETQLTDAFVHRELLGLVRRRSTSINVLAARLLKSSSLDSRNTVVEALIKVCKSQEIDLLSTLYTLCSKTTNCVNWKPFVAEHEAKIIQLLMQLDKSKSLKGITSQFIEAASGIILSPTSASVLVRASLCRICAGLCRQSRLPGRMRVLLYDMVAAQVTGLPTLTVAVAGVWPQLLQKQLKGLQALVGALEYVVMQRVTGQKVRLTKLALCLRTLCQWAPAGEDQSATSLVKHILQQLQQETDKPAPNTDLVCELEQALILIAGTEDWAWTNNVLVVDTMWPRLRSWAAAQTRHVPSDTSHAMCESLVRLMGHIVSQCPAAHTNTANDVISMMRPLVLGVPGATIPTNIQHVALESLLWLAPFDAVIVAETANSWMENHSTQTLRVATPTRTSRRGSVSRTTPVPVAEGEHRLKALVSDFVKAYCDSLPQDKYESLQTLK